MKQRLITVLAIGAVFMTGAVGAENDVQWIRVTVFLEAGSGAVPRAEESLIPGGVYSLDEVEKRGQEAVDKEILRRIRFLGESMREVCERLQIETQVLGLEEGAAVAAGPGASIPKL